MAGENAACCYLAGGTTPDCVETNQAICDFLNGNWYEGLTCEDVNNCDPDSTTGACCFSGSCQTLTELDCTNAGGSMWIEEADCNDSPSPCGQSVACCYGSSCENEWSWYCTENGGEIDPWNGPCGGGICQPLGACCEFVGFCYETTQYECEDAGWFWTSGSCEDSYCMKGTCCLPNDDCDLLHDDDCNDAYGIWQGHLLQGCDDGDGEYFQCPTQILIAGDGADAHYATIQEAINAAQEGAHIWVLPGVYTGSGDASQPVIDTQGKSITIKSWRPSGSNEQCIIDGEGLRRCVEITEGAAYRPSLIRLTFRNGFADDGGGLRATGAVYVSQCRFESNNATDAGGGVWLSGEGGSIRYCTFESNTSGYGGALYAREGSSSIYYNEFNNNTATQRGGAIRLYQSTSTIYDCDFTGNSAVRGGAMHLQGNSDSEIDKSVFTNNTASSLGGAVCNNLSDSIYDECTFIGNAATGANGGQGSGGAIYNDSGSPVFKKCRIQENTADVYGGGMYNWYATPVIEDTQWNTYRRISDNISGVGGGIFSYGAGPSLESVIVCGNLPSQIGGSWLDLGENCLAECCESNDDDNMPDECQAGPCPGDTDCSRNVNIDDLLVALAEFNTCTSNCAGDVDGNGTVNIDDLLIIIENWGQCP